MERDGACSHMSEVRSIDQTPKANPFLGKFERHSHDELYSWRHKRMKINNEGKDTIGTSCVASLYAGPKYNEDKTPPKVVDYSDPFSVPNLKEELDRGIYGSVTKDIEALRIRKMQMLNSLSAMYPSFSSPIVPSTPQSSRAGFDAVDLSKGQGKESQNIVDLDDDCFVIEDPSIEDSGSLRKSCIKEMQLHAGQRHLCVPGRDSPTGNKKTQVSVSVIILDSDEEDGKDGTGTGQTLRSNLEASNSDVPLRPQIQNFYYLRKRTNLTSHSEALFHEVRYSQEGTEEHGFTKEVKSTAVEENQKASGRYQEDISKNPIKGLAAGNCGKSKLASQEKISLDGETTSRKEKGLYVGVKDGYVSKEKNLQSGSGDDGLVHCHHIQAGNSGKSKFTRQEKISLDGETTSRKEKGLYVGVQDLVSEEKNLQSGSEDDGLASIWGEMALALELSKDAVAASKTVEYNGGEEGEECGHSFVLKDDLGYVCRVCGVVEKSIEMIFEYQWIKGTRTTRTYMSGSQSTKDRDQTEVFHFSGLNVSEDDLTVTGISVHPMHMKQMKPHQLEGFNFLINNLVTDKPGGCILAHAPGSGKTFMIISFVQSYLAKYPNARPLVILPKSIMTTWKKEFEKWQVEDIPLYDFYSVKAENRGQQLDVLKNWVKHKSVLFLGYKQFANIICGSAKCPITASCHDILLKVPTILIMDEGHTPRNEDTNVLYSLAKVETPLKVVLSGTLYQNHVKEVFNILNLVRPKFLKLDTSQEVIRRVLSKVQISGGRRKLKTGVDTPFFDLVEETLQNDEDFKRKVTVIQDLREMTKKVLHYYKGDFLEELPGLVDYTILLNLSTKQKQEAEKLKKLEKFKRSSMGSSIYIHPQLKDFSENVTMGDKVGNFNEDKIDELLNKLDVNDGVKTKFFLSLLCLCESAGEKLLVFSHYLLPLRFLERLAVKTKGWVSGKEIFMISGDSSTEHREWSMENFNISPNAKIFFGSIKACGEGISLVGASRILILDVHLNPSVTRQAIGRAFRPGQVRKVYTYRLVAADSPEEEDHNTCFRKELISKMWFEWSEYCGHQYFEMQTVSVKDCNDLFLESPLLGEDVKILYKR